MSFLIGAAFYIAAVIITAAIELTASAVASRLVASAEHKPRSLRSIAGDLPLLMFHMAPLGLGLVLLKWQGGKPHSARLLLLLLIISLLLRTGWHAAGLAATRSRLTAAVAGCAAAVVVVSKLSAVPPWIVTIAFLSGAWAIVIFLHAVVSGRVTPKHHNAAAFAAAIGLIVLVDLGLAESYWRWDLTLLGLGTGYTLDSPVKEIEVDYFNQPRDLEDEQVPLEPGNRFRILLLGGSSTAGAGVEFHERFQAVLARALNSDGRDIEVVNGGYGKYVTSHMVLDAIDGYRELKPDIVLLYIGFNDCGLIQRFSYELGPPERVSSPPDILWPLRKRPTYQLIDRLLANVRSETRRLERMPEVSDAGLTENLRLLKSIYGEQGSEMLLFLEATRTYWPECRATMMSAAQSAKIDLVDTDQTLRDTFTMPADYLLDPVHPNPLGHWAIGMLMQAGLMQRNMLPD